VNTLSNNLRQRWQNWLKITVSLFLIVYLLRQVSLAEVWSQLQTLPFIYAALSILVLILSLTLFAFAWLLILQAMSFATAFNDVWTIFFQSAFINNFVTFIGGDILRTVRLGKATDRLLDATVSVLVSRLIMLYTLLLMAAGGLWLWAEDVGWGELMTHLGGAATAGLLLFALIYLVLCRLFQDKFAASGSKIGRTLHALFVVGYRPPVIFAVGLVSFLAQLSTVWAVWWLAAGFQINIAWWQLILFLSIVGITLLIPISFNGLGVREIGLVNLLQQAGVDPSLALALSLATTAAVIVASFPGGLLMINDALGKPDE